jgi:class 3 adenylate cyclase
VIGGAAHNFGVAPMLWRGIGIGPIADAVALVFPEHGRDTADSDRSAGRVGADCFGGERVKAVAFLQSVRLLNRQLGTIGFEGRFDYAAIGTVSKVASRLCDEAKPGQILISPRVLTKVENVVKVEPVGEFELKGIRRPLAAYNVVAAVSE